MRVCKSTVLQLSFAMPAEALVMTGAREIRKPWWPLSSVYECSKLTKADVDTTTSKNFKGKNTVLDRNPTTKELVPKKCVRVSGKLEWFGHLKARASCP